MSSLRIYFWICLSPFIWFILSIAPFFLKDYTENLQQWMILVNILPILSLALLWYTQKQNQPKAILEHDPNIPPPVIWIAAVLVSIGALILGSEIHNIYLDWQGRQTNIQTSGGGDLSTTYHDIKESTLLSLGLLHYFVIIRPWTDSIFFYRIFHSNLGKLKAYKVRIIITSFMMLVFAWHMGFSSILLCFFWTWMYERTRHIGPMLLAGSLVGGLQAWVILGQGPQIQGFDLQTFAWQPWWFNVIGLFCLIGGTYMIQSISPYWVRSAMSVWRMMEEMKLFSKNSDESKEEASKYKVKMSDVVQLLSQIQDIENQRNQDHKASQEDKDKDKDKDEDELNSDLSFREELDALIRDLPHEQLGEDANQNEDDTQED